MSVPEFLTASFEVSKWDDSSPHHSKLLFFEAFSMENSEGWFFVIRSFSVE